MGGLPQRLRVDKVWTQKKPGPSYDRDFSTVTLPYPMTRMDNLLVRRSLALREQAVSYDEAMSVGMVRQQIGFRLTHLPGFVASMKFKAGEGPSVRIRRDGGFVVEVLAKGAAGEECRVEVAGQGDPGYLGTSIMLAE